MIKAKGPRNSVNTGAAGLTKKRVTGTQGGHKINQKLNSTNIGDASGVNIKSYLEPAAKLPYKGHTQTGEVGHGKMGLLAGCAGKPKGGKLTPKKGANYM